MVADHVVSGIQPLQVLPCHIHVNEKTRLVFQESVSSISEKFSLFKLLPTNRVADRKSVYQQVKSLLSLCLICQWQPYSISYKENPIVVPQGSFQKQLKPYNFTAGSRRRQQLSNPKGRGKGVPWQLLQKDIPMREI